MKGSAPKPGSVLTVFDWSVDVIEEWVADVRRRWTTTARHCFPRRARKRLFDFNRAAQQEV